MKHIFKPVLLLIFILFQLSLAKAGEFVVTVATDTGATSIREAINFTNLNPGLDTIKFAIPGTEIHYINVTSPLPTIMDTVIIDGFSQSGATGVIRIVLSGGDSIAYGLHFGAVGTGVTPPHTAHESIVVGLAIERFLHGIRTSYRPVNRLSVINCIFSNNATAATEFFRVTNSTFTNNTVTGLNYTGVGLQCRSAKNSNITNNSFTKLNHAIGLYMGATNNLVEGNGIYDNSSGIHITSYDPNNDNKNILRRNSITNNTNQGIYIVGPYVDSTVIEDNWIGVSIDWQNKGNGGPGITIYNNSVSRVFIRNNIIGFNGQEGIFVHNCHAATITGNYIGIAPDGTDIGNNMYGIELSSSTNCKIGDGTAEGRNHISNNNRNGIYVSANSSSNEFHNNVFTGNVGEPVNLNNHLGVPWGNNSKKTPVITDIQYADGTYTILVSSSANDKRIEIYTSNSTYTNANQLVSNNATLLPNGLWQASFPWPNADEFFVVAATDSESNTSEFGSLNHLGAVVINTNDHGYGSLRAAIDFANTKPGTDSIIFNIPGEGPYRISITTALPVIGSITDSVNLDGKSQEMSGLGTGDQTVIIDASAMDFNTITHLHRTSFRNIKVINFYEAFTLWNAEVRNCRIDSCQFVFQLGNIWGNVPGGKYYCYVVDNEISNCSGVISVGTDGTESMNIVAKNNYVYNGIGSVGGTGAETITIEGNVLGQDKSGASFPVSNLTINVSNSKKCIIRDNVVFSNTSYLDGIYVYGNKHTLIENNYLGTDKLGREGSFTGDGVDISTSDTVIVRNNRVKNCGGGIAIFNVPHFGIIEGNICTNNRASGIGLQSVSNFNIRNNIAYLNGYDGISVGGNNISITDNFLGMDTLGGVGNNQSGLSIGFVDTITISRNFFGFNRFSGLSTAGNSNIKYGLISENKFSKNLREGISVYGDNNLVITNNEISENAAQGIFLVNTSNGIRISNNEIKVNQKGIQLITSSNNTIDQNRISGNYKGIEGNSDAMNNSITGNTIDNNTIGIDLYNGALAHKISRNIIAADSMPINLNLNHATLTPGNNSKDTATISSFSVQNNELILSGTSAAHDSVEIFVTTSEGKSTTQFVGAVKADDTGMWNITIPEGAAWNSRISSFYTTTATDGTNNTSQLSAPFLYPVLSSVCWVINTNDSGPGSLRDAIECVNNIPGKDSILFAIPGEGPYRISLLTALPSIGTYTDSVIVDGSSQITSRTGSGDQTVIIDGSKIDVAGYYSHTALNSTIFKNLTVVNFHTAFTLWNSLVTNCKIDSCITAFYLGFTSSGGLPGGDYLCSLTENEISNFEAAVRFTTDGAEGLNILMKDNFLFKGQKGITGAFGAHSVLIENNYFGQDKSGASFPLQREAIDVAASNRCIARGNVILSNTDSQRAIYLNAIVYGLVENNFVGTDKNGTSGMITGNGISIAAVDTIIINNNIVKNCGLNGIDVQVVPYIGEAVGNRSTNNAGHGMSIKYAVTNFKIRNNNLFSNEKSGLFVDAATSVTIIDNFFGLDSAGGLGNKEYGLYFNYTDVDTISRNFFGFNSLGGFYLAAPTNTVTGEIADNTFLRNEAAGMTFTNGAADFVFTRNQLISNTGAGIVLNNSSSKMQIRDNEISGNQKGVELYYSSYNNIIINNTLDNNNLYGIDIYSNSYQNKFSRNVITGSTKPIQLNRHSTVVGPGNNRKDSANILSFALDLNQVTLTGISLPDDSIEVFVTDAEGKNAFEYVGSAKTDATGNWSISIPEGGGWDSRLIYYYAVTATDSLNNTSEFSNVITVPLTSTEICLVVNTNNSGPGSLREAINCANSAPDLSSIIFNIDGSAPYIIQPTISLPPIIYSTVIDGYSQDGIQLNGSMAGPGANGFHFQGTTDKEKSELSNLDIRNFQSGVMVDGHDFVRVSKLKMTDNNTGVSIIGSEDSVVVTDSEFRNNTTGLSGGNAYPNHIIVRNCLLADNDYGISLNYHTKKISILNSSIINNTYSGITAGGVTDTFRIENNIGYGNGTAFASLNRCVGFNIIKGNNIGLDSTQSFIQPGNGQGITCFQNNEMTIIDSNIICGTSEAIWLHSSKVRITRNYIGTDVNSVNLGNQYAISTASHPTAYIGGSTLDSANVIGFSEFHGINGLEMIGEIRNNYIGVSKDFKNIGNASSGIQILSNSGPVLIEGNYIGFNTENGISDAGNLQVKNNYIGGFGNQVFPNKKWGITAENNSLLQDNFIAHNDSGGVKVTGNAVTLSGNVFSDSPKAIWLNNGLGNNNKQPATFLTPEFNGSAVILKGTGNEGDTVQVFSTSGLAEEALKYLGQVAVSGGEWTLTVPVGADYSPLQNNYFVNTATELQNTSQLSTPFQILRNLCSSPSLNTLASSVGICQGDSVSVEAGIAGMQYDWRKDNISVSSSYQTWLNEGGKYVVEAKDSYGCTGYDTIQVNKASLPLTADFLMSSDAGIGDKVVVVDVSLPEPDSTIWNFGPADFTKEAEKYILTFEDTGTFVVQATSHLGFCVKTVSHTIKIGTESQTPPNDYVFPYLIEDVKLGPNPNRGRFVIKAALTSEEDVRVEVMSMYGSVVFRGGSVAPSKYHELTFNLTSLRRGYYFVKVTSGSESKILRMLKL